MGIYVWEEYFLKAVRVLQMLCTCSHELLFAYELSSVLGLQQIIDREISV
jgi:hypothetical protein